MLYAYRAVMAVGVGILYDFPILYFAINVFDLYPQASDYHVKVCDLWLFHVPDTFVMGYHTAPTHY